MNYLFFTLGTLLYVAVIADIIITTITVKGGGWVTGPLSTFLWKGSFYLAGKDGNSRMLTHIGYVILIIVILFWMGLICLSLVLLLISQQGSVIDGNTKEFADIFEKVYYALYTISTLGIGDYLATNTLWRWITGVYSFTGISLITMSITYFLPVLSAVIKQRKLANAISGLGRTPQEIFLNYYNGNSFDALRFQIISLANELLEHSQNHKAYPIIHFFHENIKSSNVIVQLAQLNEFVLIAQNLLQEELTLSMLEIRSLASALNYYVMVVSEFSNTADEIGVDFLPQVDELGKKQMLTENFSVQHLHSKSRENRRVFITLLRNDGWNWKEILKPV